jgi:hypothetical protein
MAAWKGVACAEAVRSARRDGAFRVALRQGKCKARARQTDTYREAEMNKEKVHQVAYQSRRLRRTLGEDRERIAVVGLL